MDNWDNIVPFSGHSHPFLTPRRVSESLKMCYINSEFGDLIYLGVIDLTFRTLFKPINAHSGQKQPDNFDAIL